MKLCGQTDWSHHDRLTRSQRRRRVGTASVSLAKRCSSDFAECLATRYRPTGVVELVVACIARFGTVCPGADKHQNLSWGGGSSLSVVASDRRGGCRQDARVPQGGHDPTVTSDRTSSSLLVVLSFFLHFPLSVIYHADADDSIAIPAILIGNTQQPTLRNRAWIVACTKKSIARLESTAQQAIMNPCPIRDPRNAACC